VDSHAQRGGQEERATDEEEKKGEVKRSRSDSPHDGQGNNREEVQQQNMEGETKEKAEGGRRSWSNVHSVVASLGYRGKNKITIIYMYKKTEWWKLREQ